MPLMEFDPENKSTSVFDTEKLTMRKDEKARLVIMDEKPHGEVVHYVTTGSGDNERSRYYVCLGDRGTIKSSSSDPERCPACKAADSGFDTVRPAQRRFVINIGRYRTNAKGEATKPLSLALQVWMLNNDKFNKLVDRKVEHKEAPCTQCHGDLRKHDFIVTCTAQQYQNMDIDISPAMLLAKDKAAVIQYKELQEQRHPEIEKLLGEPISYEAMERVINGATPEIGEADVDAAVGGAIEDIMGAMEKESGPMAALDSEEPFSPGESSENGASDAAPPTEEIDLAELLNIDK